MNAARVFALLVVASFYGVGLIASDGVLYMAVGTVLLLGFAVLVTGILRPRR